ncbi:hypothetical protein NDGK_01870 [Clostridiales bacterium CHKCI001]|nr:hypothetical protein NDGK_01870 [Clostridiales bacterium CHKCI001]
MPINSGSHFAYQDSVVKNLRKYYPNPDSDNLSSYIHPLKEKKVKKPKQKGSKSESIEKITVTQLFSNLQTTDFSFDDQPYASLFKIYHQEFLNISVEKNLINPSSLSLSRDGTLVVTSARERKHRVCDCIENCISDCKCNHYFSQPDCDIGWDSSRDCFYHGYDLYMLVASDSESDLPVFPLLNSTSKHDSHGFLETFFRMKSFLPNYHVNKWLLDSAHDATPYYRYCRKNRVTLFIDINEKRGVKATYKDNFTIGKDNISICRTGRKMNHDGSEPMGEGFILQ